MPSPLSARKQLVLLGLAALLSGPGNAQNSFAPLELPFAIVGALPGDQMYPSVSFNGSGGYVVWQDNATDPSGRGISAQRLNGTLSGEWGVFRINERTLFDQEKPQVTLLKNGGAVFVWQSGSPGVQDIHARFLAADGTFVTGDVLVNTYTNNNQVGSSVACLADGNVIVAWTSFDRDFSMQGVYAQRFSPLGEKLGSEFRINASMGYNQRQRTPAVAALDNGNFAVAWVKDSDNSLSSSNIVSSTSMVFTAISQVYYRVFTNSGTAVTSELRANLSANPICANPAIAGLPGGGFTIVWNQRDVTTRANGWDIYARSFNATGGTNGLPARMNAFTHGDQFLPRISAVGADQLIVWTSLAQDGSQEGVFGRFFAGGAPVGDEFLVNANQTISKQMHPAVAADGVNQFLVLWTSFTGVESSFDVFAQRYAGTGMPVITPGAPFVSALSSDKLQVTWPGLAGYASLAYYALYMDGSPTPIVVTGNAYVASGLEPGSSHTFNLAYHYTDGSESPLSPPASKRTWSFDGNGDGLPDDWQIANWPALGPSSSPLADPDQDGANNLREFLSGTDPKDSSSVLRMRLTMTRSGGLLSWRTQPGLIYQVQKSVKFEGWTDYGPPRLAAGTLDSVPVEGRPGSEFYRVIRVR